MRRIGHGEWRSGEGIAGAAVRGSGDTPERAPAQADRAAAGKSRWLATPMSRTAAGAPHLARERERNERGSPWADRDERHGFDAASGGRRFWARERRRGRGGCYARRGEIGERELGEWAVAPGNG
jgi:hypothetical protein